MGKKKLLCIKIFLKHVLVKTLFFIKKKTILNNHYKESSSPLNIAPNTLHRI